MADSWEDYGDPKAKKAPALNANAPTFTFNPTASTWTPGGATAAAPAPVAPGFQAGQAAATAKVTEQMAAASIKEGAAAARSSPTRPQKAAAGSTPETAAAVPNGSDTRDNGGVADMEEEEASEELDENDPLWKVTLRLAGGDRKAALKMLEDPDSLMAHPEVIKVIEGAEPPEDSDSAAPEESASGAAAGSGGDGSGGLSGRAESAQESSAAEAAGPSNEKEEGWAEGGGGGGDDGDEADAKDEAEAEEDPREHVNLVFIGHVDAGKSTLSGNILYIMGFVDVRTIERYEREAKQRNRDSWFLAYIMDTNEEERAKGKTVEVGRAHFETAAKRYTILDAPGHNAYVPNMIQGAAQADVGILVISARRGEFETGFEKGGQTREHALLAKTLGVQCLIVAINKMDDPTVNWSKERFDECVNKLRPFLKQCGFVIKTQVKFLALSGLSGANIKEVVPASTCPWWHELVAKAENNTADPTLIGLLDKLQLEHRDASAPLRVPVLDRYVDRGTIALGKVEQGLLETGQKVLLMPTKQEARIEAIFINDAKVRTAKPGENVTVKLSCGESDVSKGFVLCDPKRPAKASKRFLAKIFLAELLETRPLLTAGFDAVFHGHTCEEECVITDLLSAEVKGKVQKRPRFAKPGVYVNAVLEMERTICVERYKDTPALGRFTLRTEGHTIAIGMILEIKTTES